MVVQASCRLHRRPAAHVVDVLVRVVDGHGDGAGVAVLTTDHKVGRPGHKIGKVARSHRDD